MTEAPEPWRRYYRLRKMGWSIMHARAFIDHLIRRETQ